MTRTLLFLLALPLFAEAPQLTDAQRAEFWKVHSQTQAAVAQNNEAVANFLIAQKNVGEAQGKLEQARAAEKALGEKLCGADYSLDVSGEQPVCKAK